MLIVIFMYAVLAATFTVAKKVLEYADPYFVIAIRMLFAGSIFLLFQYIYHRKKFFLHKKDLWLFCKAAFFYIYLAFIPEFWALTRLSSSKVVILYSITPFIVAVLAWLLVSEKLTTKKVFGMVIGFIGIIPILLTHDQAGLSRELFKVSKAEGVLLIAIVSGAYAWFLIKQLMDKGYALPMINGITMLMGGIAALLTSFAVEGVFVRQVTDFKPFILYLALLIFLANGIFYNLYGWLLRRYSFTLLSFTGFLTPIFGSLYGYYFLSEQITWYHFASLVIIGTGLIIFYKEEWKQK
jgi:drug/metabolite transporter (DMT)-like permease